LRGGARRVGKLLAQYELYKFILPLPGSIVEVGVYKGASLMRLAAFRALLENDHGRAIHGFDAFGTFPREELQDEDDVQFIERFEMAGGPAITRDALTDIMRENAVENVHLHEGDIFKTLPELLRARPELRIALLHLDVDVYEPTAFAFEQLFPRMVPGGLILVDDYGRVTGATRAADEFGRAHDLKLRKLPFYDVPAFFEISG